MNTPTYLNDYKKFSIKTLDFAIEKADLMMNDHIAIIENHRSKSEKLAAISVPLVVAIFSFYLVNKNITLFANIMILSIIICLCFCIFYAIYYALSSQESYAVGLDPSYIRGKYFIEESDHTEKDLKAGYISALNDHTLPVLRKNAENISKGFKMSVISFLTALILSLMLMLPNFAIGILKQLF